MTRINDYDEFGADQSHDYRSFQEFIRCSYVNVNTDLTGAAYQNYFEKLRISGSHGNETEESAASILDALPMYQLKAWSIRNLRRFKYSQPDLGIDCLVNNQSAILEPELEKLISESGDLLKLNPDLALPDYFKWVDFHQQPGGVWRENLDGLIYDYGRRTTNPSHDDPNKVYKMLWKHLPKGKKYDKVLDWGTGHGGGIISWMQSNPISEGYGVDVAAPCLKIAHVRAREANVTVKFSQQDIAKMDYEDNYFDMVFHMFMLHEIPQQVTPKLFAEVHRVLKPGGVFIGMEICLVPDEPVQHIMQFSDCWLNNEPYMAACVKADYPSIAKAVGFRTATALNFSSGQNVVVKDLDKEFPTNSWNHYVMEK
ncbi:MAG: hypothetical protein CMM25_05790 [Rhodospirillaceae bacterium]|nr:hypothetical protein [Rhodospirillaceae bacterium]